MASETLSAEKPRNSKIEERRKQIMDAATTLIIRKGYHGTTMDDIVKESGLSKGSLYWYFKSKKEIMLALIDRDTSASVAAIEAVFGGQRTFREKIKALLDYYVEVMLPNPEKDLAETSIKLILEFWQQAALDPEVAARADALYVRYNQMGEALVAEAVAAGEIPPMDGLALTELLSVLADGLTWRWILNPQGINPKRSLALFYRMLMSQIEINSAVTTTPDVPH